jgi:UDP-2,4-diacetamido-2,4,6-trideoxy-beta-L-altropyranose hydrolase
MKVAFRVDASQQMGSGHVMRCLTLADALRAQGAQCRFICREHPGNLIETIQQRGYTVNSLLAGVLHTQIAINIDSHQVDYSGQALAHAAWLGCTWQADATDTAAVLAYLQPDWLVVDHYALDHRWETALAPHHKKLMVIDDLADRTHQCNLLLDQNLGRQPQDYAGLVPPVCQVLTGPQYALLRPEFAALRAYSLQRRQTSGLKHLLITMGGVDQPNATGQTLQALKNCPLSPDCRITVVMGLTAPWLEDVKALAAQMPWPTDVLVNITDMAQRMADSDLAIGAAGSTAWERCCLGLPTLMVVLADNQMVGAAALELAGAAALLGRVNEIKTQLPVHIAAASQGVLSNMSNTASQLTDGHGAAKVLSELHMSYDSPH